MSRRQLQSGLFFLVLIIGISINYTVYAELQNQEYIDFSSDRSTLFFRLEGGNNDKIFFDFFSPFDPTTKVKAYDPLVMYELENKYEVDGNQNVMIHIEELKKLYAPYFDFVVEDNVLVIRHTYYEKVVKEGFGDRSTTLEYTKKVWDVKINLEGDMNSGVYSYTEYQPVESGRNKGEVNPQEINEEKSVKNEPFLFSSGKVTKQNGSYYVPISQLMAMMGKVAVEESGYLAIQQANLADVTMEVERSEKVEPVVIPRASNLWNAGAFEEVDSTYTWADYMNDVADGKRTTGWLWRAFYMSSGNHFKDENGNEISLEANRIVPFNMYVPTTYNDETRLLYMLHGGTGNENTPTHRIIEREEYVDKYAEKYNYIVLSPNGWTQNPIWREKQALYSFEKSFEMLMNEFPVNEKRVFISGNSLGGRGTIELMSRFPNRFQGFAISAPKIADRASSGKGTVISIEDTDYDLSIVKDIPALIIQGTADSTTSFKTQIGNPTALGSISKAIMPKLTNATYLTVEEGNHSFAYATALEATFDFFESILKSTKDTPVEIVKISEKGRQAYVDEEGYKLGNSTQLNDGTVMISLEDLKEMLGDEFKFYSLNSYDVYKGSSVNYYTVIYRNQTLNIILDEKKYRKNMERYKEDANIIKSGAQSDEDLLDAAPTFTVAPYEKGGQIFVPAFELLGELNVKVEIMDRPNRIWLIATIVTAIIASFILLIRYRMKKRLS